MRFDLTGEIKLSENNYRHYQIWRLVLYFLALLVAVYFSLLILFPVQNFNFSFSMLTSNKGNVLNPRFSPGALIKDGIFPAGKNVYFDTSLVGNYSKARVTITPNAKSAGGSQASVQVRKSFQAFFYPQGDPIGFKDGTLVKNNGNYYIVSNGKLLRFENSAVVSSLGFPADAFVSANDSDLKYNPPGDDIASTDIYPDATLFKINNDYYILENQTLKKFISEKAFLSSYNQNQAISKDEAILQKYPVSPDIIGFSDGSLVSYGVGAYIISGGKIYPIGDPEIFVDQGFSWNDIIPISGDEFSLYQQDKLFSLTSPHPDGTILMTAEDSSYYLVQSGQKLPLPSAVIAKTWLKKSPIIVTLKSLDTIGKCNLQKSGSDYFCEISLGNLQNLSGNYYEFKMNSGSNIKIDNLNVLYIRNMTLSNLKLTVRDIILKIKGRYGIQQTSSQQ